ncbi:MAG: Crp/Fnr family transcriptional regulator [Erysipelotrichales bacterium]|nr:Crp/Fnr family transcriptional regulator [Erysipelotrichales bacterium]
MTKQETIEILQNIFDFNYCKDNSFNEFSNLYNYSLKNKSDGLFVRFKKNDIIIEQSIDADYLYFLISGHAFIINAISFSTFDIVDYSSPLDILGLIEPLNDIKQYTAYVVADSDCLVYKISYSIFKKILITNPALCFNTLKTLSKLCSSNMTRAESKSLLPPKDMLGHYLYLQSINNIPYTYPFTREYLSTHLHLNLRTLYRYLNEFKFNNMISLVRGKIIINNENFKKLEKRYKDIIL